MSCDKAETNASFAKELNLDYAILSDPTGKAAKAYGVFNDTRGVSKRVTFIISKDGKILKVDQKISLGSHASDIAEALGALNIEKR